MMGFAVAQPILASNASCALRVGTVRRTSKQKIEGARRDPEQHPLSGLRRLSGRRRRAQLSALPRSKTTRRHANRRRPERAVYRKEIEHAENPSAASPRIGPKQAFTAQGAD